jgi:hypothetical protein
MTELAAATCTPSVTHATSRPRTPAGRDADSPATRSRERCGPPPRAPRHRQSATASTPWTRAARGTERRRAVGWWARRHTIVQPNSVPRTRRQTPARACQRVLTRAAGAHASRAHERCRRVRARCRARGTSARRRQIAVIQRELMHRSAHSATIRRLATRFMSHYLARAARKQTLQRSCKSAPARQIGPWFSPSRAVGGRRIGARDGVRRRRPLRQ